MSPHKVAVNNLTAQRILSVKDSMIAEKTFLYSGLPTVNQILYQSDIDQVPKESLVTQARRWAASVPGHLVRHLKVRRRWACCGCSLCKP